MPIRHLLSILTIAVCVPNLAFALLMSPRGMPDMPSAADNPAIRQYETGMSALLNKDWRTAETAFKESARLDPASPLPLIGLADIAAQNKRSSEAWTWLQKASEAAPKSGLPYHAMGRFHYNEKAYAKAEQAFKKALATAPDNIVFNLDLADLYANNLSKPESALPYYSKATELNPKHAGAHHGKGMVLWKLKRMGEAESSLRKAAELSPGSPISWQALGALQVEQNKSDAALVAFQNALKAQAAFSPALMGKGDAYLGLGDMKQALSAYQQAAKITPKDAMAHLKMGMAFQGLGRQSDAEAAYKRSIALNPKLALAYNNLAWMAADSRTHLANAEQWAIKAVELAPGVADFLDTLGWVYRAQAQYAQAEKTLQRAAQLQPSAQFFYHLGVVYQEQSKLGDAEKAFRKSLSIQKDFSPSLKALAALKGSGR